jgi:hypothetical protein
VLLDQCRQVLTKFRLSSQKLRIESDRYGQNIIERSKRVCKVCGSNDIEDEYHFILTCTTYKSVKTHTIYRQLKF